MKALLELEQPVEDVSSLYDLDLAERAATVLSYTYLKDQAEQVKSRKVVLETLRSAGIDAFTQDSVDRYKEYMVSPPRPKRLKRLWAYCFGEPARPVRRWARYALGLSGIEKWLRDATKYESVVDSGLLSTDTSPDLFTPKYRSPVPEFALETALKITELFPDCQLFVDELTEQRVVVDPFLVAYIDNQYYFVEVWDEPTFKQVREFEN